MERLTDRSKEIPLPNPDNALFWARVHEKLARYEDAEQNKRLIVLPCKVGDTVYELSRLCNDKRFLPFIHKHVITAITTSHGKKGFGAVFYYEGEIGTHTIKLKDFGDTVFLTREEAEAALKGATS